MVSFGGVLWMLEKAGVVPMHIVHNNVLPAIQCAENIALWWLWEHQELTVVFDSLAAPPFRSV